MSNVDKKVLTSRSVVHEPQEEQPHQSVAEVRRAGASRRRNARPKAGNLSKRARVRRRLEVAGPKRVLVAASVILTASLLGAIMSANYAQFRQYDALANAKAQQLQALKTQHEDMNRRLAFLQLPKGREQVLLEHGYLQPNDRILLFPQDEKKAAPLSTTKSSSQNNDVSQPVSQTPAPDNSSESSWSRAGNSVSRWWNDVNNATASNTRPDKEAVPLTTPQVATNAAP
jgi:hypothetical protein